jgi:hypothetical protein
LLPDLFKRLKPLYGKRIDDLWVAYELGSPEDKQAIAEVLTILAVKRLGIAIGDEKITLEPPPFHVITLGEYTIGNIEYPGLTPYPFTLHRKDLLRHLFVLGPSGTGKSTLIIGLLRQLLRDGVLWWSVDFKRNYRCLLHDQNAGKLVVLTVGRGTAPLSLNMLRAPPGVAPPEWVEGLTDLVATSYLLMQGARNVLKESLLGAIELQGDRATLRDALSLLKQQLVSARSGSRRYGWLESSYRSIEELTKGAIGESLNAINGTTLADLLRVPVVFELQALGEDQKRCFCLFLLQAVLLLRKHQADEREVLRHVLVFDEAHNVFPKDQWGQLGVPSKLAREVREYGEGIIAATQQADVADSLIANSGVKIILRTDYPKDVDFASKLLQIDPRWLAKIPLGQGIARLPTRFYAPFLFSFPEQPLKNQSVSDDLVRDRYAQWRGTGLLDDDTRRTLGGIVPLDTVVAFDEFTQRPPQEAAPGAVISDQATALLNDIADYPISTTRERYERLGWQPRAGTMMQADLLRRGLIAFEMVKTLRSQLKILTLTKDGAAVLGVGARSLRHGGAAHAYWVEQCRRWLRRHQYDVTLEFAVGGGRTVDVYGTNGSDVMMIEVETGKGDIDQTIQKLMTLTGRRVLFVFDEETRQALRSAKATCPDLEIWIPMDLQK